MTNCWAAPVCRHKQEQEVTANVRHHRNIRYPRQTRHRSCGSPPHERIAVSPRPGRRRPACRTGRRPRPPPALDHRSVHRPATALQRGSDRSASSSTAKSTTIRNSFQSCRCSVMSSTLVAIPKSSSTLGNPGAQRVSTAFAACSPSPCGTATAKRCFSPATALGSSRFTTLSWTTALSSSGRNSSRCSPMVDSSVISIPVPSRNTSPSAM